MPTAEVERVYALTRIRAGEYLLPSNDGQRLFRIYRYYEDGSAYYEVDGKRKKIVGWVWAYATTRHPALQDLEALDALPDDVFDQEHWQEQAFGFQTRAEAIADALRPKEA